LRRVGRFDGDPVALSLSASERTLRARAAAHALHASGRTNTGPATVAQLSRFERQVDPDGTLPPDERARRARHALIAYMSSLSLKASRARSKARQRELLSEARGIAESLEKTIDEPEAGR
jgi:hypothetical protein